MQHFQLEQEPDKERVTSTLKSLDSLAPKSKFLVGGNLTLADLFLIQSASHAFSCVRFNIQTEEEVRKKQKAIFKWYSQIMTTPQISQVSTVLGLLAVTAQKEQKEEKQQVIAQPKKEAQVSSLVHVLPEKSWAGRYRIQYVLENWENYIDKVILVAGWTKTIRFQGNEKIAFVELNDGSTVENIQIVVDNCMEEFSKLKNSANGGSIKVQGKVIRSLGQGQHIEVQVNDVKEHFCRIVGTCDQSEYPLSKKDHKMETLRNIAHLRPRTQIMSAIMRVRNACAFATHKFFQERGFLYIHTPIITASDCEGAGEMFQVSTIMPPTSKNVDIDYSKEFFTKPAFLTVSGQLAVENYACALCDVYTFGPTFRAENSHTSRHLAEFWMIEPEICFAELEDDMQCAESYLKYCVEYCLTNLMNDLKYFEEKCEKGLIARLQNVVQNNFARITYTEAIELVNACPDKQTKFKTVPKWGEDMNSEHERYIAEELIKGPVIVYNYPKEFKAFYMKLNEDNKTVRAMDILVPKIGEVIGGSQREDNLERLDEMLKYKNLNVEDYWWYRDLRKYGTVPHAGFGLGFERLVMMITGVENIRDVIPYPRYPGHAEF